MINDIQINNINSSNNISNKYNINDELKYILNKNSTKFLKIFMKNHKK
jgi:hypothetical protein